MSKTLSSTFVHSLLQERAFRTRSTNNKTCSRKSNGEKLPSNGTFQSLAEPPCGRKPPKQGLSVYFFKEADKSSFKIFKGADSKKTVSRNRDLHRGWGWGGGGEWM